MRIWKRLNLCKTFWSGERSCLIVSKIWLRCDKVKYFSYHFFKKCFKIFILSRWKYFYFDFLGWWKKKYFMKNIFCCLQRCWMKLQWSNTLQLVWIVCRDDKWYKHYYTLCNCHTLWLIVNKIRNLYINFSRMFARSNSLFNNMFTLLILNVVQSISCKWLINILVCGVQTS